MATAEHKWQPLAWNVNAPVAIAEHDLTRPQDCIPTGLSAMEGSEIRLAAQRVHMIRGLSVRALLTPNVPDVGTPFGGLAKQVAPTCF